MSGYDSRPDTYAHIGQVRGLLLAVVRDLLERGHVHDLSKLEYPEKRVFDEIAPGMRELTYGSPEYEAVREAQSEGMRHHYAANRHHPEHHDGGIHGMNLLDLVEMLADWKAATLRHDDGNLDRSFSVNRERYGYGDEIEGLLRNTARDLGWL